MTSFVGPLYRMSAVQALDPPKEEFFVWGDDVEYSLRLDRLGEIRVVPEAVDRPPARVAVAHDPAQPLLEPGSPRPPVPDAARALLAEPLRPAQLHLDEAPLRGTVRARRRSGTTLQFVLKHLLYDDRPFRRIPWIVRYARDGRRGRFHNIPPDEWARMVRRGDV